MCLCQLGYAGRKCSRAPLACHAMVNTLSTPPLAPLAQGPGFFDPSSEVYNRLLKERIVFLGSEVNDQVANYLTAQMLYLEGEDPEKDIWLYINSPGGSVTAGMAIYDTMQFIEPDVATICMGLGASMGQFLLCAGAPGKRFSLPARPHHDAPALGWLPGPGLRHRHPGRADDLHQALHGREDRRAHRPDRRADRGRTPSATAGSPPSRPRSTASSTRSSCRRGEIG